MNQPSNHTQNNQSSSSGFPSNQSAQTNPFTADLKGEFTSNFGTNTNAMSQIFKDGGFAGGNVGKWIAVGVLLLVVGVAAYYLTSEPSEEDDLADSAADMAPEENQGVAPADLAAQQQAAQQAAQQQATQQQQAAQQQAAQQAAAEAQSVGSGNITLMSPVDGDSRSYDETAGPAKFSWEGGPGTIVFARSRSMNPVYMRVPVSGRSYNFYNPYPGTWYWKVETEGGSSEVRSFNVETPAKRNFSLREPISGGSLAANGGVISWNADPERKVAFYRVEFSADGKWSNPSYRFASSGDRVQTQGLNPGQYQMRLGAFSEVAGRWEYSEPVSVNVQ